MGLEAAAKYEAGCYGDVRSQVAITEATDVCEACASRYKIMHFEWGQKVDSCINSQATPKRYSNTGFYQTKLGDSTRVGTWMHVELKRICETQFTKALHYPL